MLRPHGGIGHSGTVSSQEWRCPSCGLLTQLTADRVQGAVFALPNTPGTPGRALRILTIVCPNHLCGQLEVTATMHALGQDASGAQTPMDPPLRRWEMLPGPGGKELPDYVPELVGREYAEATQILAISPSASAVLARRCLQAIVRDFWGVKGNYLADELELIRDKVDQETWEAIDAVRRAGNIARHLEKGVNVLSETDAEEPRLLLGLIDYLVENWYVARRRRQQRLATIKNLAPAETPPGASRRPPGR